MAPDVFFSCTENRNTCALSTADPLGTALHYCILTLVIQKTKVYKIYEDFSTR
eukprot:SAG11_NODE_21987_length_414_cov_1.304762_1_plen_52_part_10